MAENLLPCPFCGGEACENEHKFVGYTSTFGVVCLDCCAETRQFYNTSEDAIAAWNSRADHIRDTTKKVSNADRIRGMSEEELAGYIFDLGNGSEYCYGHCAYQDDCAIRGLDNDTCIRGVIDWLRQPAETEGTE